MMAKRTESRARGKAKAPLDVSWSEGWQTVEPTVRQAISNKGHRVFGGVDIFYLPAGKASGTKSTMMLAVVSRRTSALPAMRYSSSAGSCGRFARRVGGVDCSGSFSGNEELT